MSLPSRSAIRLLKVLLLAISRHFCAQNAYGARWLALADRLAFEILH